MPSPGRPPQPPGRLTIALSDVSTVAVYPPTPGSLVVRGGVRCAPGFFSQPRLRLGSAHASPRSAPTSFPRAVLLKVPQRPRPGSSLTCLLGFVQRGGGQARPSAWAAPRRVGRFATPQASWRLAPHRVARDHRPRRSRPACLPCPREPAGERKLLRQGRRRSRRCSRPAATCRRADRVGVACPSAGVPAIGSAAAGAAW